jgi:hypothetical protein
MTALSTLANVTDDWYWVSKGKIVCSAESINESSCASEYKETETPRIDLSCEAVTIAGISVPFVSVAFGSDRYR